MTKEQQFYLVVFSILPEAIKKTIRVKEMLKSGSSGTINEYEALKETKGIQSLTMKIGGEFK